LYKEIRYELTEGRRIQVKVVGVEGNKIKLSRKAGPAAQRQVSVILGSAGPNKIAVIKVVHEVAGLGLAEAKDLVDSVPKSVVEGVTQEAAEAVSRKFVYAGAAVEVR
jgi:large subunit ribosomal protein L7/L12